MEYLMSVRKKKKAFKPKQVANDRRHEFLLSFFEGKQDEVEVNGYTLIRQFNPVLKKHLVSIYTKDSFEKYQKMQEIKTELEMQGQFIRTILK